VYRERYGCELGKPCLPQKQAFPLYGGWEVVIDRLEKELKFLKRENLFRKPRTISSLRGPEIEIEGKRYINFSSNNYLGLADSPLLKKAALEAMEKYGIGSGASRLMSGTLNVHKELEQKIAQFKGEEDALVFPTGYMANLGAISTLAGKGDAVIVDRLNHASIIDGAKLSRARIFVYPHRDTKALEKVLKRAGAFRKRLVITDTLFSMDGDIAPLPGILGLCRKYKSLLMVDEAHATGVFGKRGSGLVEEYGLSGEIDIVMGTMSKALGGLGGYIAGKNRIIEYLRQKARTFIYTTSLPVSLAASSLRAIEYIENNSEERKNFRKKAEYVRNGLLGLGYNLINSGSQIIPVMIGPGDKTVNIEKYLFEQGLFIIAIRPPTVPKGSSRFRITIMANHKEEHLHRLLIAFENIRDKL
jgi:8-amino-7-oxononanoate synthase